MPRDTMSAPAATADSAEFYARVIKRLGRNAREGGHGPLDRDDATRLWRGLLTAAFTPSQEAALLMGLRVHGESAAMLVAFAQVTLETSARVVAPEGKAVIVLHCLGTARKQSILAPLLALALARAGAAVLVVTHDALRGTSTTAVLEALGERAAETAQDASASLTQRGFAWLPVERLAPQLARVLARRAELGFRNSAHSLIKLLVPVDGRALVVANYTHPSYRQSFAQAAQLARVSALLVRGTEGDPIAWEADAHPLLAWLGGEPVDLPVPGETGTCASVELPPATDAVATARFCERVLSGAIALPRAIERQRDCLLRLAALETAR
jgi:anthranilate phosphoribosyltransferase